MGARAVISLVSRCPHVGRIAFFVAYPAKGPHWWMQALHVSGLTTSLAIASTHQQGIAGMATICISSDE